MEEHPAQWVRETNILKLWWAVLRSPGEAVERVSSSGVRTSLGLAAASFALWAALRYALYHGIMLVVLPGPTGPESQARFVRQAILEVLSYALGLVLFMTLLLLTTAVLHGVLRVASSEQREFGVILTVVCASSAPMPLLAFSIWAGLIAMPWIVVIALIGFRRVIGLDWIESSLLVGLSATIVYGGSIGVAHIGRALSMAVGAQ